MRTGTRVAVALILLVAGTAGSVGAMNLIQTARLNEAGRVSFTFGGGLVRQEDPSMVWFLTPQVRVAIGVSDGINLAFQSGVLTPLGSADPGWLGVHVDARLRITEVPGSYTLSWGVGGGYGLDFFGEGWGIFGELLFESQSRSFPIFVSYRGVLRFDDMEELHLRPHWSGGVHLRLAPLARLLLVMDSFDGTLTLGLGLEIML